MKLSARQAASFLLLAIGIAVFPALSAQAMAPGVPRGRTTAYWNTVTWRKFFPGEEHEPNLKENLESYIQYDRRSCQSTVSGVLALLWQYGDAAAASSPRAPEIRSRLVSLIWSNGESGPCFRPALEAYLAGSVFLLHPGNSNPNYLKGIPEGSRGSFNVGLTLSAVAFMNIGKIQFLTPLYRHSALDGGAWVAGENDPTGYRFTGAFDCETGMIFIDPSLPPYDLAATYVHELDHTFRFAKKGELVFSPPPG